MGKLFDFDNFDFEEVLKQPLNILKADASFVKDIFSGDFKEAFGNHQDKMTEIQGHMGLNKDNKLVKNSDAIAGAIVGGIFAAPVVAGALGSGAAAGGSTASGAGASTGSATGAAAGASGSSGGILSSLGASDYMRLGNMAKNAISKGGQQAAPAATMSKAQAQPTGGGQLGTGMTFDKVMNLYNK